MQSVSLEVQHGNNKVTRKQALPQVVTFYDRIIVFSCNKLKVTAGHCWFYNHDVSNSDNAI